MKDILVENFGDKVDTKYDVEDPSINSYTQITEKVKKGDIYLPVVLLDDVMISNGYVSYPRIIAELTVRGIEAKKKTTEE